MAIGGGMSCVKYLLFAFNLLFAITGLIILIVGIKAVINASPYVDLTHENFYKSAPIVLILVGIVVFVVAFFGCCGAVKENHCMIVTFSVFLLVIFVAEVAVGVASYLHHKDVPTMIEKALNETMTTYPNSPEIAKSFDIVQTDLQCCGINGPADWSAAGQKIPTACCLGQEITSNGTTVPCTIDSPTLHKAGCLPELVMLFKGIAYLLGAVGVAVAVVQLLGVMFACFLARSIRNQYETV